MMTQNEREEYAAELIALSKEKGADIQPQDLVDLIERRGEVTDADDQAAILNLAAEILHEEYKANQTATEAATAEATEGGAEQVEGNHISETPWAPGPA